MPAHQVKFLPRLPLLAIELVISYFSPIDLGRLAVTAVSLDNESQQLVDRAWVGIVFNVFGIKLSPSVARAVRLSYPLFAPLPRSLVSKQAGELSLLLLGADQSTSLVVEYVGTVEGVNRSVQSDVPFPSLPGLAPVASTVGSMTFAMPTSFAEARRAFAALFSPQMPCWSSAALAPQKKPQNARSKFVSPFLTSNKHWCLRPRHIAYYEVSIESLRSSSTTFAAQPVLTECVAVGLATEGFSGKDLLPGWSKDSFGFHGDDGAIFHGRGRALKSFGPTFGPGDTVGCGLDIAKREIFYTLNGKMLGVAFSDIDPNLVLYPTVGIDANVVVRFNFGLVSKPFACSLENLLLD